MNLFYVLWIINDLYKIGSDIDDIPAFVSALLDLDLEGTLKAKPMVMVGRDPIIKHIINNFSDQGFGEFVLCLGHKSETIIN